MIGARMHYATIRKSELKWRSASVPTSSHPSWIKAIVRDPLITCLCAVDSLANKLRD